MVYFLANATYQKYQNKIKYVTYPRIRETCYMSTRISCMSAGLCWCCWPLMEQAFYAPCLRDYNFFLVTFIIRFTCAPIEDKYLLMEKQFKYSDKRFWHFWRNFIIQVTFVAYIRTPCSWINSSPNFMGLVEVHVNWFGHHPKFSLNFIWTPLVSFHCKHLYSQPFLLL